MFGIDDKKLAELLPTVKKITCTHKDGPEEIIEFDREKKTALIIHIDGQAIINKFDEFGNIINSTSIGKSEWSKITYHPKFHNSEILYENSSGYRIEKVYDELGRLISTKDSDGYESKLIFEHNGTVEHLMVNDEFISHTFYDNNKNVVTKIKSYPPCYYTELFEYDSKGNLTKAINVDNRDTIEYIYDDNNRLIRSIDKNSEIVTQYVYDTKDNLTYISSSDGSFEDYGYDERNNITHYSNSNGIEYKYKYEYYDDELTQSHSTDNNISEEVSFTRDSSSTPYTIHKTTNGLEQWFDIDHMGNTIHYRDSSGHEFWKDYNDEGNLIHTKVNSGYESAYMYTRKGSAHHIVVDSNGIVTYYNSSDDPIYRRLDDGFETWFIYDEEGNFIRKETSDDKKSKNRKLSFLDMLKNITRWKI